jgi:endonuclease III
MLSSQTKDTVTAVAMRGMQEKMPGVRILIAVQRMPTDGA